MSGFVIILLAFLVNASLSYEVVRFPEGGYQKGVSSFGGYYHHVVGHKHGSSDEVVKYHQPAQQYQWVQPASETGK